MGDISQFAHRHAYVPSEGNAEGGKYTLARMPHQADMLDDPTRPQVRECFWMMASQAAGKTMSLILVAEYAIRVLKESIIMSRDTRERCLEWMRDKFLPAVKATVCMTGLLKETRQRDAESTALSRKYPGGTFKLIGAQSEGSFRSTSAGIILQDEIDAYEATKEGDPCALIDRAAITFDGAWKIKCSTPTLEGFSRIHEGYKRGDQQGYYVPCPLCGHFQVLNFFGDEDPADPAGVDKEEAQHPGGGLKFSFTKEEYERFGATAGETTPDAAAMAPVENQFTWTIDPAGDFPIRDTKRALYVCEKCHRGWTDQQRIATYLSGHEENSAVVVGGRELRSHWAPRAPFGGVASKHLSGMYQTMGMEKGFESYLHQFAERFLTAKAGGRETLMAWWNMFEALPYAEKGERVKWKELQKRAEDYDAAKELPPEVVWIVWASDVHPDRVEFMFYGWGDKDECWALEHHVEYGDFDMPSMRDRVWEYLQNKKFNHPTMGLVGWQAGVMDSGHQTKVQAVYQFTGKHWMMNVYSCKGFDQALGAISQLVTEKRYNGRRWNFNTDYLKNTIFERLKNNAKDEPGSRIHFPKAFPARFYTQLCSERKVLVKQPNGGFVTKWMKNTSATRNEVLDMTVYARGLYDSLKQQDWIARKSKEAIAKWYEMHPTERPEKREVLIGVESEVKQPELKEQPERKALARPVRRKIRIANPFRRF